MLKVLIFLLALVSASLAEAQIVLRTFASHVYGIAGDTSSKSRNEYWSFHYNENAVLDSLRYSGDFIRELGGLDKMKPFIDDLYDWETLPPNLGGFRAGRSESQRLVITEPQPGVISILDSLIYSSDTTERGKWSIDYSYDVSSGRLLKDRSSIYTYEDSAGKTAHINVLWGKKLRVRWNLFRDTDGAIIGIERLRPYFPNDSLQRIAWYQILRWQPSIAANSARRGSGSSPEFAQDFPWLPEGEPAAWIYWNWTRDGKFGGGNLVEHVFDSAGRIIAVRNKQMNRRVTYNVNGPIELSRYVDDAGVMNETRVTPKAMSGGNVWDDWGLQTSSDPFGNDWFHLFTYEYGYRYEDGLWGDRFSPDLVYEVDGDTIKLRIEESRSLKGLTACVIDTSEKEVAQIPITERKTTFIFHRRPRTSYAVRWKYDGRKIVDQAF